MNNFSRCNSRRKKIPRATRDTNEAEVEVEAEDEVEVTAVDEVGITTITISTTAMIKEKVQPKVVEEATET
ncbi:hypothetical protein ACOSQ2_016499 [Xanthoceras sorbifolium]